MAPTYLQPPSKPVLSGWRSQPDDVRRRAVAIVLTILVHVLIVWLLLNLGPRRFVPMAEQGSLATFDVGPDPASPKRQQTVRQQQRPRSAPAAARPPVPPPVPFKDTSGVIWLTRDQFAASDIAKSGKADDRGTAQTADTGSDSAAPYGPGEGPGGARLYAAEWYREPTDAELRTFLPPMPSGSWGVIACRTIPEYRVENCQTMGDSPVGSGIATGMRRAAWQFRVRPPRIGGKPQYGEWVRIRIDFTARGAEVAGGRR